MGALKKRLNHGPKRVGPFLNAYSDAGSIPAASTTCGYNHIRPRHP